MSTTPLPTPSQLYAEARQHAEQTLAHRLAELAQMHRLLARFEPLAADLRAAGAPLHACQLMLGSVWVNGKRCNALTVTLPESRVRAAWLKALHACGWKPGDLSTEWSVTVRHGALHLRLYCVSQAEVHAVWQSADATAKVAA